MSTYTYPNADAIFYQHYQAARRDEVVGILLALFLGGFGIHHFYLRRTGLGILYLCFCWTGIPSLLGLIECFFMPGRVREYNAMQAAAIAASLGIAVPGWGYGVNGPINVSGNIPPAGAVPNSETSPVVGAPAYVPPSAPFAMAPAHALSAPLAAYALPAAQNAVCPSGQKTNPPGARFCVMCGAAL
jgi:TM2 domain-containing membrane protein YozV